MEIRKLTSEADWQAYWQLRLRMLREYPASFGEEYDDAAALTPTQLARRYAYATGDDNFILGAFDPQLVGSMGLVRDDSTRTKHKAEVYTVYIAPEAQQRGLAHALLDALISQARTIDGLEQLYLGVDVNNAPAIRLYTSHGFTTYGTAPRTMKLKDSYVDEHLMLLYLDK